jgi:superfamily II DNA or RNA helicase
MGQDRSNEEGYLYDKAHVVVSSVQTMSRPGRHQRFRPEEFGLVIFDEAHHATAESYLKVLGHFRGNPDLKWMGVTATPDRTDEEELGKVFETVAFEYGIKEAIHDGWLVPIEQQLVWVEGLDFSACRTTAGDLNQGDLAKIMEMEKALHGVVAPTMDIAGDRKTLVFTASVAQAERGAEIANRHRPGCAEWISGETFIDDRREILRRYANQDFQFLFNCAIALEGFDDPGIQVVAMARPTKSRSLYSQAIGRGTRPLPDLVDGIESPDGRRQAIAGSYKPNMLVLDFVGNSGRHKLIHATDVLGCEYDDDELEAALFEIQERSKQGEPTNVEEAFSMAAQRREAARQQREAEAAKRSKADQEAALRAEAARRRQAILAKAYFGTKIVDAFAEFDILPKREPGYHKGRPATEKMLAVLRKAGIADEAELEQLSYVHAGQLISELKKRWDKGLCTLKMARVLKKHGYDPDVPMKEASAIIDALAKNGWKRPAREAVPA